MSGPAVARVQAGESDGAVAGAGDGPTQSLVALVFHNLSHQSRAMAIKAARAMIDELAPDEYAGVFAVELSLDMMAPFTRDKAELRDAMDKSWSGPP